MSYLDELPGVGDDDGPRGGDGSAPMRIGPGQVRGGGRDRTAGLLKRMTSRFECGAACTNVGLPTVSLGRAGYAAARRVAPGERDDRARTTSVVVLSLLVPAAIRPPSRSEHRTTIA